MKQSRLPGLGAMSLIILLCGVVRLVYHLITRFIHLTKTVTEMFFGVSETTDIAVSVYDAFVLVTLSWGVMAMLQIVSGLVGLIFIVADSFRKKPLRGMVIIIFSGVITSAAGILSSAAMIITGDTGVFTALVIIPMQIAAPILFTSAAVRFRREKLLILASVNETENKIPERINMQ